MNKPSCIDKYDSVVDDGWSPIFGVEDVWKELSKMKVKATGSDGIPSLLYKNSALIFAAPIHHILMECCRQRKLSAQMKIADVSPIPKPNDPTCLRPISLLSVPAKLFELFLLRDLKSYMMTKLGKHQYGIRTKSSTTHAIIMAHESLTKLADDSNVGAAVLLSFDLTKAYDKVSHSILMEKILGMDFPTGFVHILKNYLHSRYQRVRLNGCLSDLRAITSGVPQGSLLGPYLFGLYVASLRPIHDSTCMIKYVDDICLVMGVQRQSATNDVEIIEEEMSHLREWSKLNELTLNESKTQGLVHYNGASFKVDNPIEQFLPSVNFQCNIRFLGVVFDENLKWKTHVRLMQNKCLQRMYILRRMKCFVTSRDFVIIYDGLIRSLIEYACPVFFGLSKNDSALLQDRCLRIKGVTANESLDERRRKIATKVFFSLRSLTTELHDFYPSSLPSGCFVVPLLSNIFVKKCLHSQSLHPRVTYIL